MDKIQYAILSELHDRITDLYSNFYSEEGDRPNSVDMNLESNRLARLVSALRDVS